MLSFRQDRYESAYGQWSQDTRDYRRGRYRGRGRGRLYKNSPPRSHEQPLYNRYRDENFVSASPKHYRSPSRYYDHRMSPRAGDYPRDSRERDYRSYDRETESAARDRNRRRSHSNSTARNQYEPERERDRDKEKDRHRENDFRRRSRSRRSRSRRYTPVSKAPQETSERSKDKSIERSKDWDKERNGRHKSRERISYDEDKDKRKYTNDRDRSKDVDRDKKRGRTRSRSRDKSRHDKDRSRSKEKKKRSLSRDKRDAIESGIKKRRSSSRHRHSSRIKDERSHTPDNRSSKDYYNKRTESPEKNKEKISTSKQREESAKSPSKERLREHSKALSPKVVEKEDDDKKDKKKDKDKKKKKKEKETDEERAARKKKKKDKKEEKKRKQEIKGLDFTNKNEEELENNENYVDESKNTPKASVPLNPNFVSSFRAVESDKEMNSIEKRNEPKGDRKSEENNSEASKGHDKESVKTTEERIPVKDYNKNLSESHIQDDTEAEASLEDDNIELQIHASYESLLEETGDTQKKGILASVPEISKWELDENQAADSNPKTSSSDAKSPEFPAKVTREVIKRAENAIFKKAVNAIREPAKKSYDKEERKDRKVILAPEKDKIKEHNRIDTEKEKVKRVFLTRDKEKFHYGNVEVGKTKPELKRALNSLHITIPLNSDGGIPEREISVGEDETRDKHGLLQKKNKNASRSPPAGRVPIKERLGSKIEKQGRHPSPQVIRPAEKRIRNADDEDSKPSRKEYQRPALLSTIESIDAKRSSIDEAHFVPNYDESSDDEENSKVRHNNDKEGKSGEAKKRMRSSSESSDESVKKRKKKRSKNKKKKQKRSKKHISDSSDSSDSDQNKKKHKKSKKKKKSKH